MNFMKMIETLKEETKNSLKERREKTNKRERNQYISERNSIKQMKQTPQTVQDYLKIEIEAIKKTQTKGILEMENLGK